MDDDLDEDTEVFSALWTGLEDPDYVMQAPFTLTIIDNDGESLTIIYHVIMWNTGSIMCVHNSVENVYTWYCVCLSISQLEQMFVLKVNSINSL